eukprot:363896-Chlamydomonas_euryale.AAC.7
MALAIGRQNDFQPAASQEEDREATFAGVAPVRRGGCQGIKWASPCASNSPFPGHIYLHHDKVVHQQVGYKQLSVAGHAAKAIWMMQGRI